MSEKRTRRKRKVCSTCLQEKWLPDDFYKDCSKPDNHRYECKECTTGKRIAVIIEKYEASKQGEL